MAERSRLTDLGTSHEPIDAAPARADAHPARADAHPAGIDAHPARIDAHPNGGRA